MNGGGDNNNFFFFNSNEQRQLTISTSSSTTTVAKPHQCRECEKSYQTKNGLQYHIDAVHRLIRHPCPNCKSTFARKGGLAEHLRRSACARKPFQCDRCRKRFPSYEWLREHKVWHIEVDLDRFFKWFDLYAYPCFYCCSYFASLDDAFTHVLEEHQPPPFAIIIKTESSSSDDGDG